MFSLTYDLWTEMLEEIVGAHDGLFSDMHLSAERIEITKALVDELKAKGELSVGGSEGDLLLRIELLEDQIDGFAITLTVEEPLLILQKIMADVVSDHGFSLEEIEGFELEHGLDLMEEILVAIEERQGVRAGLSEESVFFELLIFDSRDIDDLNHSGQAWMEDMTG